MNNVFYVIIGILFNELILGFYLNNKISSFLNKEDNKYL